MFSFKLATYRFYRGAVRAAAWMAKRLHALAELGALKHPEFHQLFSSHIVYWPWLFMTQSSAGRSSGCMNGVM